LTIKVTENELQLVYLADILRTLWDKKLPSVDRALARPTLGQRLPIGMISVDPQQLTPNTLARRACLTGLVTHWEAIALLGGGCPSNNAA
jgi:hypothetical protein